MGNTMKRWAMDGLGRDRLKLVEAQIPVPGPGEILVRVSAVSLNYRDKLVIEQGMGLPLQFPFTPASDMAGTVVALGAGASRFSVGERVISTFVPGWIDGRGPGTARQPGYRTLGGTHTGVLSEYVILHEDWAVAAPRSLRAAASSTLPCAGLTAWFALVEQGDLHAGQTVVVQGTGGVALFGMQIAAAHGAEVIVTSSSDAKLDRARALGAHHGINRSTTDWVQAVYEITRDRGADHILEIAGGASLGRSIQATAVHGCVSVIGILEGLEISGPTVPLMLKQVTVRGIGVGHRRALEDLVRAVDRVGLAPVIDAEYAFTDVHAALDHLERGPFGKIVIDVSSDAARENGY
ncbi:Alcohol dehydrogenase [Minicystis rosea]|nr:Alcohol dehydrogenase [Minicystis rosea]